MHKFRVLLDLYTRKISEEQAHALLPEMELMGVRQVLTRWGPNLRYIVPIIDKLMQPVNTKADQVRLKRKLTTLMGTTGRQTSRLLKTSNIQIPTPLVTIQRKLDHLAAVEHARKLVKYALDVVAGLRTAADAAEDAEVTVRHMYRLVGSLLKYEGYKFRDLHHMSTNTRKLLADRLEIAHAEKNPTT